MRTMPQSQLCASVGQSAGSAFCKVLLSSRTWCCLLRPSHGRRFWPVRKYPWGSVEAMLTQHSGEALYEAACTAVVQICTEHSARLANHGQGHDRPGPAK